MAALGPRRLGRIKATGNRALVCVWRRRAASGLPSRSLLCVDGVPANRRLRHLHPLCPSSSHGPWCRPRCPPQHTLVASLTRPRNARPALGVIAIGCAPGVCAATIARAIAPSCHSLRWSLCLLGHAASAPHNHRHMTAGLWCPPGRRQHRDAVSMSKKHCVHVCTAPWPRQTQRPAYLHARSPPPSTPPAKPLSSLRSPRCLLYTRSRSHARVGVLRCTQ